MSIDASEITSPSYLTLPVNGALQTFLVLALNFSGWVRNRCFSVFHISGQHIQSLPKRTSALRHSVADIMTTAQNQQSIMSSWPQKSGFWQDYQTGDFSLVLAFLFFIFSKISFSTFSLLRISCSSHCSASFWLLYLCLTAFYSAYITSIIVDTIS